LLPMRRPPQVLYMPRLGLLRYLIGWHAEARPAGRSYNASANSANATASRLFAGSSTANS
jgi:hypothetical protein